MTSVALSREWSNMNLNVRDQNSNNSTRQSTLTTTAAGCDHNSSTPNKFAPRKEQLEQQRLSVIDLSSSRICSPGNLYLPSNKTPNSSIKIK